MAASNPIIELIAENIKDTMNCVTVGNGYHETLSASRPKRIDYLTGNPMDLDCLVIQTEPEGRAGAMGVDDARQHFDVLVIAIDSDAATDSIDTRLNRLACDIIHALMADCKRGGYAFDTTIHGIAFHVDPDGGISGVLVDVSVDYRTTTGNPYLPATDESFVTPNRSGATNPAVELIAENIKTTLNSVTAENGYEQDITAKRPKRIDYISTNPKDLDCLLVQTECEEIEGVTFRKTWRQKFDVLVFCYDSDSASNPIDTRLNRIVGDIKKSLASDPTRGGYAFDTQIESAIPIVSPSGGQSGALLDVAVDYRVNCDDPYVKA